MTQNHSYDIFLVINVFTHSNIDMDHKIVMHYRSRKRILVVVAKKVLTRLTYSWQDGKKICKVYMHIKDSKNQCTIPFKDQYINTIHWDLIAHDSVYSIPCLLRNNL